MTDHDWRDHSSHPHHHVGGDPEPVWDRVPKVEPITAPCPVCRLAITPGGRICYFCSRTPAR